MLGWLLVKTARNTFYVAFSTESFFKDFVKNMISVYLTRLRPGKQ